MSNRDLLPERIDSGESLSCKKLVRRSVLLETVGWSDSTLERRIKDGTLKEPLHLVREPSGRLLFNPGLILDGVINGFNSPQHLAVCEEFLRSLPSSRTKLAGRPRKSTAVKG